MMPIHEKYSIPHFDESINFPLLIVTKGIVHPTLVMVLFMCVVCCCGSLTIFKKHPIG